MTGILPMLTVALGAGIAGWLIAYYGCARARNCPYRKGLMWKVPRIQGLPKARPLHAVKKQVAQ